MFKAINIAVVTVLTFGSLSAFAADTWLGNVVVSSEIRGRTRQDRFEGQEVALNIASYKRITIEFEFYKQGASENPGTAWQRIDAQAQMELDDSDLPTKSTYIPIVASRNNNVVYRIAVNSLAPDTSSTIPDELQDRKHVKAHLNIVIDGTTRLSVPFDLSYEP
jgi:hypothetical protein